MEFIDIGAAVSENKKKELAKHLDQLSYASHFLTYTFDEKEYPEFEGEDVAITRQRIEKAFPEFGLYNVPEHIDEKFGESGTMVGDSIDDILDIYQDLKEVLWCWENTSVDNAIWTFENSFCTHWEQHLRELQIYVCEITRK